MQKLGDITPTLIPTTRSASGETRTEQVWREAADRCDGMDQDQGRYSCH